MLNAAKVEPGATVAVIGCGGIGLPVGTRHDHSRVTSFYSG